MKSRRSILLFALGVLTLSLGLTQFNRLPVGYAATTATRSGTVLAITLSDLLNGLAQVPYSATLSATGGSGSYTYSLVSGSLPAGLALNGNMIFGTPTTAGPSTFTIRATDASNGAVGERTYTLMIGSTGLMYYPLAQPVRLVDTRSAGCYSFPGGLPANQTMTVMTQGTCGTGAISSSAVALTGNVTTVNLATRGFVTLYPSDAPRPLVSSSNFVENEALNNAVTISLSTAKNFTVFTSAQTHVIIDITGYYAPPGAGGLYFHPLPKPVRLLDTRAAMPACQTPGAALTSNIPQTWLGVVTCNGVTIPTEAQALVGNATTVFPTGNGYLTLYPAGPSLPTVSSSNFVPLTNRNAPFVVGLSASGQFSSFAFILNNGTTDLVIDITGYYSTQANDVNGQGLLFNTLGAPLRLLDTRATGATGCYTPGQPSLGGAVVTQQTQSPCTNVPATARGLVGNVTVINPLTNGFLTFWPSDVTQPLVATSNFIPGRVFNRHFTVGMGPDAAFKRYSSSTLDMIIDISGFFAP